MVPIVSAKESVGSNSAEAGMVLIVNFEFPADKWIRVIYSDPHKTEMKGKIMSFEESLSYLAASKQMNIDLCLPETLADVNHMAEVMNICKHKRVCISLDNGELNGLTEPFLKLGIDKCIGKEKNTIFIRYDIGHNFDEDGGFLVKIENKAIKFSCEIGFHDNPVFPHLVNSLKLLKNSDRDVRIHMYCEFKELFESMQWSFGKEMVDWLEGKVKTDYIMVDNKSKAVDNNKYKIMHLEYEGERESECEYEMSENEISWDEIESLGAKNDTEKCIAPTEETTLRVAEVPRFATDELVLSVLYCGHSYIPIEVHRKELSYDDVLDYATKSKNKTISLIEPTVKADFVHMKKIIEICGNKKFCIRLYNTDMTGAVCRFAMTKWMEKNEKSVTLGLSREHKGDYDAIVDKICIKSGANNIAFELSQARDSLFPHFVDCVKAVRNYNYTVDIQMKTHFKMLFKAMNWTYDDALVDPLKKPHAKVLDLKHGQIDKNIYNFYHENCDEDAECNCKDCVYQSNSPVNKLDKNSSAINLENGQSNPEKRKIDSNSVYFENVPPATVNSYYAKEPLQPSPDIFGRVPRRKQQINGENRAHA